MFGALNFVQIFKMENAIFSIREALDEQNSSKWIVLAFVLGQTTTHEHCRVTVKFRIRSNNLRSPNVIITSLCMNKSGIILHLFSATHLRGMCRSTSIYMFFSIVSFHDIRKSSIHILLKNVDGLWALWVREIIQRLFLFTIKLLNKNIKSVCHLLGAHFAMLAFHTPHSTKNTNRIPVNNFSCVTKLYTNYKRPAVKQSTNNLWQYNVCCVALCTGSNDRERDRQKIEWMQFNENEIEWTVSEHQKRQSKE